MLTLEYSCKRLTAFLEEVNKLLTSEFPYPHSKLALEKIEKLFKDELDRLKEFDKSAESINEACIKGLDNLYAYLPLLGFLLRSTNVRNAFEVFGPLLRLAGKVLEPGIQRINKRKTRLVISSEWDFSPFTYEHKKIPILDDFLLIGLPAPESDNPFLFPIAGHELGHMYWEKRTLDGWIEIKVRQQVIQQLLVMIENQPSEYKEVLPSQIDLNFYNIIAQPIKWALKQAQESFCDFLGVRIFGVSFLNAFAYLLAPGQSELRSPSYPNMLTRVENLIRAANSSSYKMTILDDYATMFENQPEIYPKQVVNLQVELADKALEKLIPDLIEKADEVANSASIKTPSDIKEEKRIYRRLKKGAPAEGCESLADILNAAWRAYTNPCFWPVNAKNGNDLNQEGKAIKMKEREHKLKDLVLKNIEVFEVEQIKLESSLC